MTKQQAVRDIVKIRAEIITNWDSSENEYCKQWFGKNYLGNGYVACGYCLFKAVPFRGYIGEHVCQDCELSLQTLGGI